MYTHKLHVIDVCMHAHIYIYIYLLFAWCAALPKFTIVIRNLGQPSLGREKPQSLLRVPWRSDSPVLVWPPFFRKDLGTRAA